MVAAIPLMIVPFVLYNLAMLGVFGAGGIAALQNEVMSLSMLSGAIWTLSVGDVFILVALVVLFIEILKATRNGSGSLLNHMLSMLVFIAFLVEFLLVRNAATQNFFILMTVAFIDVVGGFAVSIRSAGRDVSIGL
ncbi:hypothetical protein NBH19_09825 [Rhizobium sp. S95]|uniref:Transmembrane protein n=1 Tax=Ciceribacter sichuanensis TaxID=2949647 RepID=A0AAJ1F744_9HYPH|nr:MULTISPECIES: hypothetical protein [unclassified Ciceribacter]MCM2396377.1 hypothetical protein [Ciceribacter sp. S95]MCM2402311.1 hypothetical protein [Ciceribacter sp. S153]MCO5957472.1 hypothetical protein [Ciceribacter sp. S101]